MGWAAPSVTLALIPKCPLCVAGYVAMWTGLGISLTAAAWLRSGLIVVSVVLLGCLAVAWGYRLALRLRAGAASR